MGFSGNVRLEIAAKNLVVLGHVAEQVTDKSLEPGQTSDGTQSVAIGHLGGADLVIGDDLGLGPLDLHELAELGRLCRLPLGQLLSADRPDIRHLSHELHPGVLEHIGLVAALDGYCEEFEDAHGVGVTFRADQDLGMVPIDLALCLYRATQEALGNVAKHAKARQVRVSVARDGGDVVLAVADDGCGFDLTEPRRRRGLGLVSLEERVRLVDGQVTIDTGPQRGTEIRIVVPLPKEPDVPGDGPAR